MRYTLSQLRDLPTQSNVDGAELKIDTQDVTGHGRRVWLHEDDGICRVVVEERDPNHTTEAPYPHATWHSQGRWNTVEEYEPEDDTPGHNTDPEED